METYFNAPEAWRLQLQNKLFRQMRMEQSRALEHDVKLTLQECYADAIARAEDMENYELCQALKDSAHKYGLNWQ
jgi:hypothetical protein